MGCCSADALINANYHGPQPAGSINFSREYYYARKNLESDYQYCFRTARSFRKDADLGFLELGGMSYSGEECFTGFTKANVTSYLNSQKSHHTGLYWGRPEGHLLDERFFLNFGLWVLSSQYGLPSEEIGRAWSGVKLQHLYSSFTPEFGRGRDGTWTSSPDISYSNVALIIFIHGTRYPNALEKVGARACPNMPVQHVQGYNSYWIAQWLAPGIGVVQQKIFYDEKSCSGAIVSRAPGAYSFYLDGG